MEDQALKQVLIGIQHPLENPLILDLVLGYFQPLATFQEWKNIRLVCKTWHFQTLSNWRAKVFLNLKLGPTLHKNHPKSLGVSMSEFMTLIQNDQNDFFQFTDKPFNKYKLQNLELDVSTVKKNNLFWTTVGLNITHLSLHEVNIKKLSNTKKTFMEFLVNQVPNLESFTMSNVYVEKRLKDNLTERILVVHPNVKTLSISKCLPFRFAYFPNLKEVTLDSCEYHDMVTLLWPDPLVAQSRSQHTARNYSIERLKLENFAMDGFLPFKFTELKYLSLDRKTNRRTCGRAGRFAKFINYHAETLETIEAFGSLKLRSSNDLINANLPNLTELRAYGNIFPDLSFINNTPNLKLLHLDLYGFEMQEKMKKDLNADSTYKCMYLRDKDPAVSTSVLSVQENAWQNLSYFQINYEISKNGLENVMAKWMPNLKTLKTVLDKETFPVVCENWPELEHLECMFGSSIVNENITGTDAGSSGGGHEKALVDMESLTTFKLHTECNESLLSDGCVTTGFLRVPKLTNLSICVSPEFSQDAEILLRRGIQNVQLYRNYSSNPLHTGWQCCRDSEYKNYIFKAQKALKRKHHSKKLVKR